MSLSTIPLPPLRKDSLQPASPSIPPVPNKHSLKAQKAATQARYIPSYIKIPKSPRVSKMEEYTISENTCTKFEFSSPNLWQDSFKTLYQFFETGQLCDVEVKTGQKSFKCHRVVLACVSQYFRAMFNSQMAESKQNSVTIQDSNVDENSLELLIKYAYLAKITLTVENVQRILYTSSILQIDSVADACCRFMKSHLHPSNCIAVKSFAEQHGRSVLMKIADEFICENFVDVVDCEDFVNLSPITIETLVSQTDLNVDNEAQVYEAVIKWVKHDLAFRKSFLPHLMARVRLPLLSPTYLLENVESEDLIRKNLDCRDFLDEAKYYQMSLVSLVPDVKISERIRPRKSYSGVLFCVGGRGVSGDPFRTTECYDVRKDRWFKMSDMSTRRRHVGVCSAGGCVYAVGGHDGNDHLPSAELFDPEINRWREIAPMATPRRGIALACLGGPIYAVGGLDDNTCYSVVERYDPRSDSWSFVSNMNIPRGGVGVAALKGHLYAVGGNDGTTSLDSCEMYDPFLNKWTVMSSMATPRAGAGLAVLNGCLYVVGGFYDNSPLDSVEKYDPKTNSWAFVARMSNCRGGVGVASLGGLIYAVGGHDGKNYLNSVECYDPAQDRWQVVMSISECRAGAGVVYCDSPIKAVQQAARRGAVSCV